MRIPKWFSERKSTGVRETVPFPNFAVEVDQAFVAGVVDRIQSTFHPGPATGSVRPGRELSQEELQLITAAFVVGMSSYCADEVEKTLGAMRDRVSFDEALHHGDFGYFTRENVNPEVAPALERAYQLVANSFSERNAWRVNIQKKSIDE